MRSALSKPKVLLKLKTPIRRYQFVSGSSELTAPLKEECGHFPHSFKNYLSLITIIHLTFYTKIKIFITTTTHEETFASNLSHQTYFFPRSQVCLEWCSSSPSWMQWTMQHPEVRCKQMRVWESRFRPAHIVVIRCLH